ncbi:MAG: hypothetical protein RIC55_16140 [Pirellulaceae bacterium]
MADDEPARRSVRVDLKPEPAFILNAGPNGEPKRSSIDNVVAAAPPAIAEAVSKWTGILDRGKTITLTFTHVPAKSLFAVISSGDFGSKTISVKQGDKVLERSETHVRYEAALSASDETTFSVFGIFEFENRVTERKCYVICQIEGEKPALKDPKDPITHPTGTATWIGPIVNASSPLFAETGADVKK